MGQIELMPHEVILRRDSCIEYTPQGKGSPLNAELCLTNNALLVGVKGVFGIKKTLRFPLSDILVENGAPCVCEGQSRRGDRQLHVFFAHGVESFALGEADVEDDDLKSALKNMLTSQSEKERQNIQQWCTAITTAICGARTVAPPPPVAAARVALAPGPSAPAPVAAPKREPREEGEGDSETFAYQAGSLISAASKGIAGAAAFVSDKAASAAAAASERGNAAERVNATDRCIGCGAPLAGIKGQRVVCPYCDTDQTID